MESILLKLDENTNDITSVKELLQLILQSNEKDLIEPNQHALIILRDWYLNLLRQWQHDGQLDEVSIYVFEGIPHLFLKISNYISEKNVHILKELICYKPIIDELNHCLEDIASNGKYLQDPHIKSLDHLFRAIQRLERNHYDHQIDPLFDSIVKCICSSTFINLFLHSTTQDNDQIGQKFLLHTCTDYIYSHPVDQQHKQCLLDIRQALLHPFAQWFNQHSSSFRSWNHGTSVTLRQLCFILTLSIQHNQHTNLDRQTYDDYCRLIDAFVNILYSILQSDNSVNQKLNQSLLATLTPNLYTIILSNQLGKYLKTKHIVSLILKLVETENEEIQLNGFRILSMILTEQDTKIHSNSMSIASLFLKYLNKIIDDPRQILRFSDLLRCLKNIIHFDYLKDELTKQNGVTLFLRCATESQFKPLQVQQPSLEILLALTFNREAYRQLKGQLNHFKSLLSLPNQGISRAVDSLLWRFEKRDTLKKSPDVYTYDLMISYSRANKDLMHRIADQLLQDNFRIWIDSDETFGTNMTTKMNIMDESQYILIGISDEYKQNSYCRCEAYYAYECQYKIIPLILTLNLHPDGWLTDLIKGKIYIDFIKLEFELAYQTLKTEINREDFYTKIESVVPRIEPLQVTEINREDLMYTKIEPLQGNELIPRIQSLIPMRNVREYSSDLQQWTKDDVRTFLMENQFDCLAPVIAEMNGALLYDLYRMCNENRESMFHTLKNEISMLEKNAQPLTILVYLRFLREIQKLVIRNNNI